MIFQPLTHSVGIARLADFIEKLGEETNRNWTNHWGTGTALNITEKIWFSSDHKVFVAIENDEVVAVGHLHNFVSDECYLGMAVRDDKQHCGIGSLMVEYLMKQARDLNIKAVFLDVYADNFRALRLYEKHCFQYCGEVTRSDDPRKRYIMMRLVEPKK